MKETLDNEEEEEELCAMMLGSLLAYTDWR